MDSHPLHIFLLSLFVGSVYLLIATSVHLPCHGCGNSPLHSTLRIIPRTSRQSNSLRLFLLSYPLNIQCRHRVSPSRTSAHPAEMSWCEFLLFLFTRFCFSCLCSPFAYKLSYIFIIFFFPSDSRRKYKDNLQPIESHWTYYSWVCIIRLICL